MDSLTAITSSFCFDGTPPLMASFSASPWLDSAGLGTSADLDTNQGLEKHEIVAGHVPKPTDSEVHSQYVE